VDYTKYQYLTFEYPSDGVLLITINRPEVLNATNNRLHWELSTVWLDVDKDEDCRIAVITGAGKAFSAGGDLDMVIGQVGDFKQIAAIAKEAADLVYNIVNCEKPVVSAINGVAVGAGLAAALMADISVIAEDARLTDGHLRLGVGAGDHAAIIWPILCGMAKAKYYLMTADFINRVEAERIGLVTRAVPKDEVLPTALAIAERLALGSQSAIRLTKRALNHWLRSAMPAFEASLAYEMFGFLGPDAAEGLAALQEKRAPSFPSARSPEETA
jgi:enoyl-CoA hydratase